MDKFDEELERFRKLLRIRHGLIAPILYIGDTNTSRNALSGLIVQPKRVLYVADEASLSACINTVKDLPLNSVECFYQVFKAPVKPHMEHALQVIQMAKELSITTIVALGSGSVTDIAKLAAHELAVELILVASAPSMNGYTSITASILHDGLKQSFHTFLAKAIIVNTDIINDAPIKMQQAGASDAMAYKAAMFDWKLSHLLLDAAYEEVLEELADLERLPLMQRLILQGLAMTYAGSSTPASGGEHMLAHIVEMMHPELCEGVLHGEMIAHTLPLCVAHQAALLESITPPTLQPIGNAGELAALFGQSWYTIQPAFELKQQVLDNARDILNEKLRQNWRHWREQLHPLLLPTDVLPVAINAALSKACSHWQPYARFTRNRFTALDLKI